MINICSVNRAYCMSGLEDHISVVSVVVVVVVIVLLFIYWLIAHFHSYIVVEFVTVCFGS